MMLAMSSDTCKPLRLELDGTYDVASIEYLTHVRTSCKPSREE